MRRPPFREPARALPSNTTQRPASAVTSARDATTAAGVPARFSPRAARQPRECLRKCRNYPECGDGEHWDWQCIIKRNTNNEVKRAYYAESLEYENSEGDDDVNELLYDNLEPQAALEEQYEQAQNAYFATRYREEGGLGFLGTLPA
jgi:hypothetical protein